MGRRFPTDKWVVAKGLMHGRWWASAPSLGRARSFLTWREAFDYAHKEASRGARHKGTVH